jgi:hypothetical protein
MHAMLRTTPALLIVALLLGCNSAKRSYQVVLHNESPRSVTVWLTKSVPTDEAGWRAPEDVAINRLGRREPVGGVVIPPGKTGQTRALAGKFPRGIDAVLRVYVGQYGFDDLLAISRGHPDRMDVYLQPGRNELVLKFEGGAFVVERARGGERLEAAD